MKSGVRRSTITIKTKKGSPKGTLSRIKRYSKQTLRDMLLSQTFHRGFKVIIGLLIIASASYGAYALIGESIANDVVVSESEILVRVGKHVQLPEGKPEAIVRVQDPESLKSQAALFENVKEGDYIVMYPTLAIVYDLRNDHIVSLKSTRR
jgi:hypothetical protein